MSALIVERFFANRDPDRSRAANVAFGSILLKNSPVETVTAC
jgi:hypothetical protein